MCHPVHILWSGNVSFGRACSISLIASVSVHPSCTPAHQVLGNGKGGGCVEKKGNVEAGLPYWALGIDIAGGWEQLGDGLQAGETNRLRGQGCLHYMQLLSVCITGPGSLWCTGCEAYLH
jgi:hypothetical protein